MIKMIGDIACPRGREHWSITLFASFKATGFSEATDITVELRKGWEALRFQHPSIACTADEDTLNYVVPDAARLEKWAAETFFVIEGDTSADELTANFSPSPFVTLHYLPRSSQIILHASHWRVDGIGAPLLMNAFFDSVVSLLGRNPAELRWGEEPKRLTPSVEVALNLPLTPTPEARATAEKCTSTRFLAVGAIGVSCHGDKDTLPAGTRSARLRLPESTTKAILDACRARDLTLTAVVHASVAAINYIGASAESKSKPYTSTLRFSLRPYLPGRHSTPADACTLYTSGMLFRVPASQSWAENAKQYNTQYRNPLTDEFLQSRRQYALDMREILHKMPADGPRPSNIDISSVEDADLLVKIVHAGEDGVLEIMSLSVGVETLTRQMYCFVWTFRNQLELNLVYNEAYHDATTTAALLDRLKVVLEKELQIQGPVT
jgi:hypothetical protein